MVIRLLGGLAGMSEGASFITLLNVGSALIAAISAYLLERKNVKGVLLAKIYMVLDAAYYLAALVFGTTGANGVDTFPAWFKPVGFLLGSVLWFAYLTLSKRVCNTYKAIPTGTKTGAATAL